MTNPVEILLVEDDPDDLDLTMRALADAHVGNRIQIARDGEEALDYLFCRGEHSGRDPNCRPKLILLDLKLPKVDGIEVLEHIRADSRTRELPVVVLTSSNQEKDLQRCYRLGVNSYIQKPVDFEQFQTTVKRIGYYWLLINRAPPWSSGGGRADETVSSGLGDVPKNSGPTTEAGFREVEQFPNDSTAD